MHEFDFDTASPPAKPAARKSVAPTPVAQEPYRPCRWRCGLKFVLSWWLFKCLFVGLPRPDLLLWLVFPWY